MKEVITYKALIKKIIVKRSKSGILKLNIIFITECEKENVKPQRKFVWKYNSAYLKWQQELKTLKEFTKSETIEDLVGSRIRIITELGLLKAVGDSREDKFIFINQECAPPQIKTELEIRDELYKM